MDPNNITVVKRNGDTEPLNISKIHKMVEFACEGISDVYISQVEMNSGIQFYDGITTKEIQEILIKSSEDLITLKQPNYQYVAARLLLAALLKELYGSFSYPHLLDHINTCIDHEVYDEEILSWYNREEIDQINNMINHDRDMEYSYATMRQILDKYLIQDRANNVFFETPQMMYIMIAATLFANYPKDTRMSYIQKYYNAISRHEISLPTPILAGVRAPIRQSSSCVLIDIDDSLDSIFSSNTAVGYYTAQRAGIGLNVGRIRAIGSKIRGGEVEHTGIIPYLKMLSATTRSCTQNGVRGGNSTTHFMWWHYEVEDLIVLKNNKGTEDNRVRTMDYSVQFNKLFYERVLNNEDITLFSPKDVPGLYEVFFADQEEFRRLYTKYERSKKIRKKKINARDFAVDFLLEALETGRIYAMNVDHCNEHSAFTDTVYMSNLCQEVCLPTKPINHIDDTEGEIALCTLSAINLGKIANTREIEPLADLAVRALDELLDYQDYPVESAKHALKRRSLGVGYIGLAHYLAKNKVKYSDPEAWQLVHDTTEAFQYYLLKASNQLAKEKGPCDAFDRTTYAQGTLPIDTYKKDVDDIVPNKLQMDWDFLRGEIKRHGLRHSTLSAQMPAESSAVVCDETNGIEPPRNYLTAKISKKGVIKQIVPGYPTIKNYYDLLWDMESMDGYIKIVAVMQKFFDQSISANLSYNPKNYPGQKIPMNVLLRDFLTTYKYGWKTRYYINTEDGSGDDVQEENCDACVI